jgi:hypothetical protein
LVLLGEFAALVDSWQDNLGWEPVPGAGHYYQEASNHGHEAADDPMTIWNVGSDYCGALVVVVAAKVVAAREKED